MFSMKRVSEMLGIPAVTIRAWENRYGIITPHRSEGGHRLFTDQDVDKLKSLKQLMDDNGLKVSEAVRLLQQEAAQLPAADPVTRHSENMYEALKDKLYQHLINFSTMQVNELMDLAFSLYEFEDVFSHILLPVLYRIGEDWELKSLTVAQEHYASQLILNRFSQFFRVLPVNEQLPKALAFCPMGEHHQIGLMHFSLFLKKKGVDVIYLGPDTPLTGLTTLIEMKRVSMITISVTDTQHTAELNSWIQSTLHVFPNLKFALGGPAFHKMNSKPLQHPNVDYPSHMEWDEWFQSVI